jgi:GDP-L-fucose synthase
MSDKKTVLITGGRGFIGRNIIEYMEDKYHILSPTHNELDLLDEDRVRVYLTESKIDIIIHCAVRTGHRNAKDPSGQLYHNTRMFFNLARNEDQFEKMIYLGSGSEYDNRHYKHRMKEEYFDEHIPEDEGGFSKYIISKYIEKHKNITELRIFGIFGKYEDYAIRFISNLICKAIYDLPLTMNQNRVFDYIYINDLMPILDYFIEHETKNNIYNVTPDKSVRLLDLAKKIKKISQKDIEIRVAKDGLGPEYTGDNTRLRSEMPNVSFMDIDVAIKKLYDWYSDNKDKIDKSKLLTDK